MIIMESGKEYVGEVVVSNGAKAMDLVGMLLAEGYITEIEVIDKRKYQVSIYQKPIEEVTVSGDTYSVD